MKDKRLKVLIVDDEIDICYLVSNMLRPKNLKPVCVHTIGDAITALKQEIPDILFLDNHLPDGMGIDFIKYVKKHYPEVCIIMITAHDSLTEKKRALKDGAEFFIGKPLTRDIIYNTVDSIILQRQAL